MVILIIFRILLQRKMHLESINHTKDIDNKVYSQMYQSWKLENIQLLAALQQYHFASSQFRVLCQRADSI